MAAHGQVPGAGRKQAAGELTVSGESLYTVFDVSCAKREGLWCAWAVGETGSLRIGVLEPEGDRLHITRRFSQRLTAPLGVLLRGEMRALGEEREHWEPLKKETLQSPYLRRRLGAVPGVLPDGKRLSHSGSERRFPPVSAGSHVLLRTAPAGEKPGCLGVSVQQPGMAGFLRKIKKSIPYLHEIWYTDPSIVCFFTKESGLWFQRSIRRSRL